MSKQISLNQLNALFFVLSFMSTEDLLTSAMYGFSNVDNENARDNERICYEALHSFLN